MLGITKEEVPPALKSHLEAQFSFLTDVSKKMFEGVQRISQLNVQVAQTLMEEAISNSHQLIGSTTATDYLSIATSQAQPLAEKIRSYQQHLNNIGAGVQVELSRTAERHVPETARTAAALAEEVGRRTQEETEKVTQRQKAAFDKVSKPINDAQDSSQQNNGMQHATQQSSSKQQSTGKNN
jgi:phasin family protein